MLLRNISAENGLCNGTRLIIKKILNRLLEAEIATGDHAEKIVYIPRMPLTPSNTNLPFEFSRTQFSIRPAFVININRAQGQTLDMIGIWLNESVFTHGQLYVALSRVSSFNSIKISIEQHNYGKYFTRNVVYPEVFK